MKKLQNKSGFTLVEMLCCIAILVIFAATVSLGMQFSNSVFFSTTRNSEARTLVSTVNSTLSDELRYATNVKMELDGDGKKIVKFTSQTYGNNSQIVLKPVTTDGRTVYHLCILDGDGDYNEILQEKAYTKNCSIAAHSGVCLVDKKSGKDKASSKECIIITVTYDVLDHNGNVLYNERFEVIPLTS